MKGILSFSEIKTPIYYIWVYDLKDPNNFIIKKIVDNFEKKYNIEFYAISEHTEKNIKSYFDIKYFPVFCIKNQTKKIFHDILDNVDKIDNFLKRKIIGNNLDEKE